jgi:hypothetical protein
VLVFALTFRAFTFRALTFRALAQEVGATEDEAPLRAIRGTAVSRRIAT